MQLNTKKGDAVQLFVIITLLFVFAVIFIIFAYLFTTVATNLQGTVLNSTPGGASGLTAMIFFGGTSLQYIFVFFFAALCLGTIITSFSIKVHPIFFPINIFLLAGTVIFAVVISNAFQMLNTGVLAATYSGNTMITYIMSHLVRFAVVVGIIDMIVLFVKIPGTNEGGQI